MFKIVSEDCPGCRNIDLVTLLDQDPFIKGKEILFIRRGYVRKYSGNQGSYKINVARQYSKKPVFRLCCNLRYLFFQ